LAACSRGQAWGHRRAHKETSRLEIEGSRGGFWAKFKSYLDRLGENGILSVFVGNGFDSQSAIKKVLYKFQFKIVNRIEHSADWEA
jgi:hypothetical protein